MNTCRNVGDHTQDVSQGVGSKPPASESGHLVFKIRGNISKKALEEINLRNITQIGLEMAEIRGRESSKETTARIYLL